MAVYFTSAHLQTSGPRSVFVAEQLSNNLVSLDQFRVLLGHFVSGKAQVVGKINACMKIVMGVAEQDLSRISIFEKRKLVGKALSCIGAIFDLAGESAFRGPALHVAMYRFSKLLGDDLNSLGDIIEPVSTIYTKLNSPPCQHDKAATKRAIRAVASHVEVAADGGLIFSVPEVVRLIAKAFGAPTPQVDFGDYDFEGLAAFFREDYRILFQRSVIARKDSVLTLGVLVHEARHATQTHEINSIDPKAPGASLRGLYLANSKYYSFADCLNSLHEREAYDFNDAVLRRIGVLGRRATLRGLAFSSGQVFGSDDVARYCAAAAGSDVRPAEVAVGSVRSRHEATLSSIAAKLASASAPPTLAAYNALLDLMDRAIADRTVILGEVPIRNTIALLRPLARAGEILPAHRKRISRQIKVLEGILEAYTLGRKGLRAEQTKPVTLGELKEENLSISAALVKADEALRAKRLQDFKAYAQLVESIVAGPCPARMFHRDVRDWLVGVKDFIKTLTAAQSLKMADLRGAFQKIARAVRSDQRH